MQCKYPLGELVQGLSYEDYASVGGLRASDLHVLKRTPAHWKAWKNQPERDQEKSDALQFGKLFHLAVEHPQQFLDTYVTEPEFVGKTKDGKDSTRSKDALDKKAAWYAEQKPGTVIVKKKWVDDLLGMLAACQQHKNVGNLIRNGVRETSLFAEDEATGEIVQCRPDFISERGFLVDFKTTRNAAAPFFHNQIFSSRYHEDPFYALAAAHYTHCVKTARLKGVMHDAFYLVAIEKTAPYAIKIWPLDAGCLGAGEMWRSHLMQLYAKCKATGKWPAYPEAAEAVVVPSWVEVPPGLE